MVILQTTGHWGHTWCVFHSPHALNLITKQKYYKEEEEKLLKHGSFIALQHVCQNKINSRMAKPLLLLHQCLPRELSTIFNKVQLCHRFLFSVRKYSHHASCFLITNSPTAWRAIMCRSSNSRSDSREIYCFSRAMIAQRRLYVRYSQFCKRIEKEKRQRGDKILLKINCSSIILFILHCTDTGNVEGCKDKATKDRGKTQKCWTKRKYSHETAYKIINQDKP